MAERRTTLTIDATGAVQVVKSLETAVERLERRFQSAQRAASSMVQQVDRTAQSAQAATLAFRQQAAAGDRYAAALERIAERLEAIVGAETRAATAARRVPATGGGAIAFAATPRPQVLAAAVAETGRQLNLPYGQQGVRAVGQTAFPYLIPAPLARLERATTGISDAARAQVSQQISQLAAGVSQAAITAGVQNVTTAISRAAETATFGAPALEAQAHAGVARVASGVSQAAIAVGLSQFGRTSAQGAIATGVPRAFGEVSSGLAAAAAYRTGVGISAAARQAEDPRYLRRYGQLQRVTGGIGAAAAVQAAGGLTAATGAAAFERNRVAATLAASQGGRTARQTADVGGYATAAALRANIAGLREQEAATRGVISATREHIRQNDGLYSSLRRVSGVLISGYVINRFARSVGESIFGFQAAIEQMRLGVAETLSVASRLTDPFGKTLPITQQIGVSLADSDVALGLIEERAIKIGVPIRSIVEAFVASAGAARRAGLSLQDSVGVIGNLVVLAQQVGIPFNILSRDVRDILTGLNVQRTVLGNILQLSTAEVQQAIRQGTLADLLRTRLEIVGVTAEKNLTTFTGLRNAIQASLQLLGQDIGYRAFGVAREFLKDILARVERLRNDPARIGELGAQFGRLAASLVRLVEALANLAPVADRLLAAFAGARIGSGIGALAGGIIGGTLAPGVGIPTGAAIGSAVGPIIGAITGYLFGPEAFEKVLDLGSRFALGATSAISDQAPDLGAAMAKQFTDDVRRAIDRFTFGPQLPTATPPPATTGVPNRLVQTGAQVQEAGGISAYLNQVAAAVPSAAAALPNNLPGGIRALVQPPPFDPAEALRAVAQWISESVSQPQRGRELADAVTTALADHPLLSDEDRDALTTTLAQRFAGEWEQTFAAVVPDVVAVLERQRPRPPQPETPTVLAQPQALEAAIQAQAGQLVGLPERFKGAPEALQAEQARLRKKIEPLYTQGITLAPEAVPEAFREQVRKGPVKGPELIDILLASESAIQASKEAGALTSQQAEKDTTAISEIISFFRLIENNAGELTQQIQKAAVATAQARSRTGQLRLERARLLGVGEQGAERAAIQIGTDEALATLRQRRGELQATVTATEAQQAGAAGRGYKVPDIEKQLLAQQRTELGQIDAQLRLTLANRDLQLGKLEDARLQQEEKIATSQRKIDDARFKFAAAARQDEVRGLEAVLRLSEATNATFERRYEIAQAIVNAQIAGSRAEIPIAAEELVHAQQNLASVRASTAAAVERARTNLLPGEPPPETVTPAPIPAAIAAATEQARQRVSAAVPELASALAQPTGDTVPVLTRDLDNVNQANAQVIAAVQRLQSAFAAVDDAIIAGRAHLIEMREAADDLGHIVRDSVGGALKGLARGEKLSEVLPQGIQAGFTATLDKMIDETLKRKLKLDVNLERNFLEFIPGLGEQGGRETGTNFAEQLAKTAGGDLGTGQGGGGGGPVAAIQNLIGRFFGSQQAVTTAVPQGGASPLTEGNLLNLPSSDLGPTPAGAYPQAQQIQAAQQAAQALTGNTGAGTGQGILGRVANAIQGIGVLRNAATLASGYSTLAQAGAGAVVQSGATLGAAGVQGLQAGGQYVGQSLASGGVGIVPVGGAQAVASTAQGSQAAGLLGGGGGGASALTGGIWAAAVIVALKGIQESFALQKKIGAGQATEAQAALYRESLFGGTAALGLGKILGLNANEQRGLLLATTGGTSFITGKIAEALGIGLRPTVEGLLGKGLRESFAKLNIPVTILAGGRFRYTDPNQVGGAPSQRPFDPTKVGDFGYPQVAPNPALANIRAPGLAVLAGQAALPILRGGRGGTLAGAQNAVLQAVVNNAAALGLALEDTQKQVDQFTSGYAESLDKGILTLRRAQVEGRITRDDLLAGIGDIAGAFLNLPASVDRARIALLAFDKDGALSIEALKRNVSDVEARFGEVGSAITDSLKTGDFFKGGQAIGQSLFDGFISRFSERLLATKGPLGAAITNTAADLADSATAYAAGNAALGGQLLVKARKEAAAVQRQYLKALAPVYPAIATFGATFGVGPFGGGLVIPNPPVPTFSGATTTAVQIPLGLPSYATGTAATVPAVYEVESRTTPSGVKLPSFATPGTAVVPGLPGQPQAAVLHGGETVRNPRHEATMVAALTRLQTELAPGRSLREGLSLQSSGSTNAAGGHDPVAVAVRSLASTVPGFPSDLLPATKMTLPLTATGAETALAARGGPPAMAFGGVDRLGAAVASLSYATSTMASADKTTVTADEFPALAGRRSVVTQPTAALATSTAVVHGGEVIRAPHAEMRLQRSLAAVQGRFQARSYATPTMVMPAVPVIQPRPRVPSFATPTITVVPTTVTTAAPAPVAGASDDHVVKSLDAIAVLLRDALTQQPGQPIVIQVVAQLDGEELTVRGTTVSKPTGIVVPKPRLGVKLG